ncbi:uncharacterized protein M421DRAFT_102639 [Didymella exigua CBS 183.55]|uniref:Uncharacterized protein n=1 Tax=Didymella exigua CBS 183.55 TaxID=1150837 RepID=A0A6A5RFQ0_9PLEO|nr:uncharacterized protein M421DRAFT_102639 [Didymella exigua CBS 183.55]KAF1926303.1 hypothetical protein M421DRAFT_102639 [Didymella exigua CBS 183.55]
MAPHETRSSTNKDVSDHESVKKNSERVIEGNLKEEASDETSASTGNKLKKSPLPETAQKATKATKFEQATKTHGQQPTKSSASSDQVIRFLLCDTATYAQLLSPFVELVCAVILSRPISNRLGLCTIRTVLNSPYEFTDADTIRAAGAEIIYQSRNDARTQHRGKTTEEIELIAVVIQSNDWHNDLEKIRKQTKNSVDEERDRRNIFYRRIQRFWDEAYPFIDARTADSLEKLGLPNDPDEIVERIEKNWQDLKFDNSEEFGEEDRKRRAFVLLLERSVGADLEKKIEDVLARGAGGRT